METAQFYSSSSSMSSGNSINSLESPTSAHIEWNIGDTINRYKITRFLGQGQYGRVFEVQDSRDKSTKALKVVRPGIYVKDAKIEEAVLRRINEIEQNIPIVKLHHAFAYNRHYCLVFEKLGKSIFDLIKRNRFKGFIASEIQAIARQILIALDFMHRVGLTHTDLKLENILFVQDRYRYDNQRRIYRPVVPQVKLIDFGGATFQNQYHPSCITSRNYRAPEVILSKFYLGNTWDMKSDIWSLGCILVELYTGQQFFPNFDDYTHLALIEKRFGRIPLKMVKACGFSLQQFFTNKYRLNWPSLNNSRRKLYIVRQSPCLEDLIDKQHSEFIHFLYCLMRISPEKRISAAQGLCHPFVTKNI